MDTELQEAGGGAFDAGAQAAQDAREWESRTKAVQKKLSEEKEQASQQRAAAVAAFDAIAGGNAFATEMRRAEGDINNQLFQANNRAAKLTAEIEALRTQFAAQLAAKDARVAELEKELQTERDAPRQSVAKQAAELVASLGHKPLAMEPDDGGGGDLMAQFEKEKDPKKRAALYEQIKQNLFT